jgi:tetratricopeptide (TPR) repeat protein
MSSRAWQYGSAVVLICLCLAAYSNSFIAGFTLDSEPHVLADPRVQQVTWNNVVEIFRQDFWYPNAEVGLYRPIATLSFLMNYAVLGNADQPFGYHCVNFAIHVFNTLLLCWLAAGIFGRWWPALITAAVFAVHPVATESVTNVSGRPDLLMAAACLGAMVLYAAPALTARRRAGIVACAVLGLFSKESAIVLLPLLVLYDLAFRPQRLRDLQTIRSTYVPLVCISLAALGVRQLVMHRLRAPEFPFVDNPLLGAGFVNGRLTAMSVIARYLKLLVWPATLSCDYSYNEVPLVSIAAGAAATVLVLAIVGTLAFSYRFSRPLFFFGLLLFGTLLPSSNLLLVIGSIMAERFLYLSLAGLGGCVAALLADLAGTRLRVLAPALAAVIVCALAARTWVRNLDYETDERLWSSALLSSPRSYKPHHMVATWIQRSADPAEIPRAIQEEDKAIQIVSDLPPERSSTPPYATLALLWLTQGDYLARNRSGPDLPREAETAYRNAVVSAEQAIPINRAHNQARREADWKRGWPDETIPDVGNTIAYRALASALRRLGREQEALDINRQALRFAPADENIHGDIAEIYAALGQDEPAARYAAQSFLLGKQPAQMARLVRFYRKLDPAGCNEPVSERAGGLAFGCIQMKSIVCGAHGDLLRLFQDTHQRALSSQYLRLSPVVEKCQ